MTSVPGRRATHRKWRCSPLGQTSRGSRVFVAWFSNRCPRSPSFRPDAVTAELAIAHLKAHPPRFLFLGLGEPDEFGHRNDYAGYLQAVRRADARIAEVDQELSRLAAHGTRTALFVTADHGRADSFVEHGAKFPESARVWLIAAGSAVRASGFVAARRQRRLADLAPTVRQIAGLPRDLDPEAGMPSLSCSGPTIHSSLRLAARATLSASNGIVELVALSFHARRAFAEPRHRCCRTEPASVAGWHAAWPDDSAQSRSRARSAHLLQRQLLHHRLQHGDRSQVSVQRQVRYLAEPWSARGLLCVHAKVALGHLSNVAAVRGKQLRAGAVL